LTFTKSCFFLTRVKHARWVSGIALNAYGELEILFCSCTVLGGISFLLCFIVLLYRSASENLLHAYFFHPLFDHYAPRKRFYLRRRKPPPITTDDSSSPSTQSLSKKAMSKEEAARARLPAQIEKTRADAAMPARAQASAPGGRTLNEQSRQAIAGTRWEAMDNEIDDNLGWCRVVYCHTIT
jgi:hypothetical protein